jgi:hypothetical protein
MKMHIHMKIETAIREVKKGVDLFGMPRDEALKVLLSMQKEGKKLIQAAGCDNFDEETGCKGHPDEETVRTVHDEDCPQCGFPETIIVREAKTMKPLYALCSSGKCDWKNEQIDWGKRKKKSL